MLYINQGQTNTLTLSINENSRDSFTNYILKFTHVMSSDVKNYSIDTSNPNQFVLNSYRYCTIYLDLTTDDLPYEGQYTLDIYGEPGSVPVYSGFCMIAGPTEDKPFTEYVSENETNENFIYIQD
jgi:hypothetical protein